MREGKRGFIKENMPRDIDAFRWKIETLIPMMRWTIAEENTFGGSKI
jgi:hypothetical protein